MRDIFAADLPVSETQVLAATQKPINGAIFGATLSTAAWRTIPPWSLVASEDGAIQPALERIVAKRMKATTVEVKSSHLPMLSHPAVVARLITQAAVSTNSTHWTRTPHNQPTEQRLTCRSTITRLGRLHENLCASEQQQFVA